MAAALGSDICDALPGLHAFTGCDTTSFLYGKGKSRCFVKLGTDPDSLSTLSCLGTAFEFPADLLPKIEKRYVGSAVHVFVQQRQGRVGYRLSLFCTKGGNEKMLPPAIEGSS